MRKIIKWFLLLNKRLYKKATFIIILALIPIVVLSLSIVAKNDSGIVTVALVQTDDDAVSSQVINDLMLSSDLIRFEICDSPKTAIESVKTGQCDSAWIFLDNLSQRAQEFIADPDDNNAMVQVVEREQTILLRLSHEKLSSALYRYVSKEMYISYVRTNVAELNALSDEQLLQYYDSYFVDGELFEFAYPSSGGAVNKEIGYLVSPIRGLLAVLVVLCAMAVAMFFEQDKKQGTFSWMPESKQIYIEFLCQIIAVFNVCAAILIALKISGLTGFMPREFVAIILYGFACALFGVLLRNLIENIKVIGALIPLFITAMIAICPVFFDFKELRSLQKVFPPTYYINAVYNKKYIVYLAIYILLCATAIFVLRQFKKLMKRKITAV